ncbi:MAG: hypothetical protein IKG99_12985 [Bacteroidaceae bacterium]|nr:hypothetical protein [Bacteroidaceae bacterium]
MRTSIGPNNMSVLLILLAAIILASCNEGKPNGNNNGGEADYPMPSPEEQAAIDLWDTLHTIEGQTLNGAQLAVMKSKVIDMDHLLCINLPVSDIDERPLGDVTYTNEETGGTIVFHLGPVEDDEVVDSLNPIGTIDLWTVVHSWETKDCLPDSANTFNRVQARGNSIYTPYHMVHSGRKKKNNYELRWFPEYYGCIIYVYPGADSLAMTFGYEESKRIYKR